MSMSDAKSCPLSIEAASIIWQYRARFGVAAGDEAVRCISDTGGAKACENFGCIIFLASIPSEVTDISLAFAACRE